MMTAQIHFCVIFFKLLIMFNILYFNIDGNVFFFFFWGFERQSQNISRPLNIRE